MKSANSQCLYYISIFQVLETRFLNISVAIVTQTVYSAMAHTDHALYVENEGISIQ